MLFSTSLYDDTALFCSIAPHVTAVDCIYRQSIVSSAVSCTWYHVGILVMYCCIACMCMKPKGLLACWLVGLVSGRPVVLSACRGVLRSTSVTETKPKRNKTRHGVRNKMIGVMSLKTELRNTTAESRGSRGPSPQGEDRKQVDDSACQTRGCALLLSVCPCFVEVPESLGLPLLSIDVQEVCFYVYLQPKTGHSLPRRLIARRAEDHER